MNQLKAVALIAFNRKHEVIRVVLAARYMRFATQQQMLEDDIDEVAGVYIYAVEETWSAATYHPMTEAEENCR